MQNENPRRHYRVAQKEIEEASETTMFHAGKKQKYMMFAVGMLLVTFIQGVIIGFLVSRNN